ncbi:MAG TPA: DUF2846 domain-containing protein [Burkholderiales bacterium]|jgi:hypothetical protein|nr:DUF2846 domain-containing protein [Burkholderiales bacterium]
MSACGRILLAAVLLCAACAPLPPSPADLQARKFEIPDGGRAAIYVVRDVAGFNDDGATLLLDGTTMITTYPGTYYRWEVAPGTHRIAGYASDSGNISVNVEAGRIYFVQQWVAFGMLGPRSRFAQVPTDEGRAAVMRSELIGGQ